MLLKIKAPRRLPLRYYFLFMLLIAVLILVYMNFLYSYSLAEIRNKRSTISFESCKNLPVEREFMASSKYRCYFNLLRHSVKSHGFEKTAQAFDNFIKNTNQIDIQNACHSWAHELGEAAVRNGSTGLDIINYCVHSCLDGCFNGAGHGYVATNQDLSQVNNFCNPEGIELDDKKKNTCFHGIGHGLVDVFGTDIKKIIGYCDLIKDPEGKAQCGHATFMMFNSIPASRVDINKIPVNMLAFCKNLDSVYQSYCYDFSGYLTYGKSKDTKQAFTNCTGVPSKNRMECYRRIGDILYLMFPQKAVGLLAQECQIGNSEENLWCSLGVGKLLITDGNKSPEKSFDICLLFKGELKSLCYKELGEQLESHMGIKDREKYCQLLDKISSKACLNKS